MRKLSLFFLLLFLLVQSSLAGGQKRDSVFLDEDTLREALVLRNNDNPDGVPSLLDDRTDVVESTPEADNGYAGSDEENKEVEEAKNAILTGLGRPEGSENPGDAVQTSGETPGQISVDGNAKDLQVPQISPQVSQPNQQVPQILSEETKKSEKPIEEGPIDPSDPRMQIRNHMYVHQPYLPAGWAHTPFYSPMLMPVPPPLMQVNFKLPEPKKPLFPSQVNMKSQVTVLNYPNHLPSPWNQYSLLHNYNPYGGHAFSMHHPSPFTPYSNLIQPYMSSMYRGMFDPLNMGIFPGSMPFSHMGLPSAFPNFNQNGGAGVGMNALNLRQFSGGQPSSVPNVFGQPRSVTPNQGITAVDPVAAGVSGLIQQQNSQNFQNPPTPQPSKNGEMKEMIANSTAYDLFMNGKNSGPFGQFGDNSYFNMFSNANMMTAPAGPFGFNSPYARYRKLEEIDNKNDINESGIKDNEDQPLKVL